MSAEAPMTPSDCDLRGMEWMPLYGARLFGSDFDAHATDTEWRAAMQLWWSAWNQVPAASLPDDDVAQCRLAGLGRDLKAWRRVKDRALHGFVICSDGRLYHKALAEFALESWARRLKDRERKAKWREQRERKMDQDRTRTERGHGAGRNGDRDVPSQWDRTTDEMRRDETRRDATLKDKEGEPAGSGAQRPGVDFAAVLFGACRAWLMTATGKDEQACRRLLGKWRKDLPDGDLVEVLKAAQDQGHLENPVPWVEKAIQARKGPPRRQHGADFN